MLKVLVTIMCRTIDYVIVLDALQYFSDQIVTVFSTERIVIDLLFHESHTLFDANGNHTFYVITSVSYSRNAGRKLISLRSHSIAWLQIL